jgi:hypothetical protein
MKIVSQDADQPPSSCCMTRKVFSRYADPVGAQAEPKFFDEEHAKMLRGAIWRVAEAILSAAAIAFVLDSTPNGTNREVGSWLPWCCVAHFEIPQPANSRGIIPRGAWLPDPLERHEQQGSRMQVKRFRLRCKSSLQSSADPSHRFHTTVSRYQHAHNEQETSGVPLRRHHIVVRLANERRRPQ